MKTNTAVLHLKNKDPQSVYNLGGRVSTSMVAAKATFTNPDPTMEAFGAEVTKLDGAIKAKDGSKIKAQAVIDQTDVVYIMLKSLLIYVNKVAAGDIAIILLSGFDCNNDPIQRDVPGKAVIKRLEDGSVPCSVKIFMDALTDADRYKVETTITPDDPESWKTELDFGSLKKLEIRDLTAAQKIYIRVSGGNTHGWGVPSEPMAFIPR
ncbi:MAG: hypothetical protein PHR83_16830 [Paludibacter sp.]|nr:hypothetical protein [Paludibacter sp.]